MKEQLPAKGVKSETQAMTSDTVDFTLPTTSTHADTATSEQPRPSTFLGSVWKFLKPRKSKRSVEKTTGSSRTGAHPVSTNSQPNTQRIMKQEKVDAEKEKRYRHEVCEKYFREIRSYLKDKPTMFHLVDEDFAIDNTVVDSKLVALKKKIVEVASQQLYWGEEVPARWILLERELMRLKAAGIKVIPRTLLEAFNRAEDVPIPTDELDLFLKFQNDIGTILYFSIEVLKDKIVLVPQWMIDAIKSLITAEMFVLRNAPAVTKKWDMFNKTGNLYPELIDAIWTKENYPDLHDNKEHILLLMEHLNIIARPICFSEDGSEIKMDYFLAPCMLKEKTPENVMFPKPDPEMKSGSSVLCYNFVEKFLPSPIFHRLLATCVSQWPIAQTKLENQIFCGCCIFSLDLHHRLTVLFREYIIFVQVFRFGKTEMTPSSKLCIKVQEFITKTLTSIIGYLGHSLKFEMSVQCPKSVGYRVDCLIPLADLQGNVDVPCHFHDVHVIRSQDVLKFWFQEEEPSDVGCFRQSPKPLSGTHVYHEINTTGSSPIHESSQRLGPVTVQSFLNGNSTVFPHPERTQPGCIPNRGLSVAPLTYDVMSALDTNVNYELNTSGATNTCVTSQNPHSQFRNETSSTSELEITQKIPVNAAGVATGFNYSVHHQGSQVVPSGATLKQSQKQTELLERYKMDAEPRGICLIINNKKFYQEKNDPRKLKLDDREGTDVDCEKLQNLFSKLHFKVELKHDQTDKQICKLMKETSKKDHSKYDCFVCCVLTHGTEGNIFGSNKKEIPISKLTCFFQSALCPSLAGKPKVFFFQACQGSEKQTGYTMDQSAPDIVEDAPSREMIPNEADFLLGFATVAGYSSYRSRSKGTWYIRNLVEMIETQHERMDLLSILVGVNAAVCKENACFDSKVYKQTPAPMFTLRKQLYF